MDRALAIIQKYRKLLIGIASATVLYALLGFFLAPWLLEKNATEAVRSQFGAELRFANVAINPFAMSLRLDGIELDDPEGDRFLAIDRIFVNFQSSSLFRWAWSFREMHINGPEVFLARDADGLFSFDFLVVEGDNTEPAPEEESEGGTPRLLVADFAITESVIHWSDAVPAEPVDTEFGPINIAIAELNTLPDRSGRQDVVITTETQGTLSWSGSLELNPLLSEGQASIKGSHFPLTSAYLKHEAGFDVLDGEADVELDYRIAARDDGSIEASVSNFELAFSDVRVSTFNAAFDREGEDRDVMTLPRLVLAGGELHWPEQVVSARSLSIDDADISLYRDVAGALNILPPPREGGAPAAPDVSSATSDATPWQLSLETFEINRLELGLEDHSVNPPADVGWQSLDVEVRDISNAQQAVLPVSVEIQARDGGRIAASGTVMVLPQLVAQLDFTIDDLALAGAHPYLKPLADVNLDSGALNVAANISSSPDDPLRFEGNVEIVDFLITETDEGSRLGSWQSVIADQLVYSVAGGAMEISELRMTEPYGDILIAEDGSINLGRVQKEDVENAEASEPEMIEDSEETEPSGDPLDITVGRVVIAEGAADFADLSLPLPFSAQIAALNGELTTIATASAEPSTVNLEGIVDEFGRVVIGGSVTPLQLSANTDMTVAFENVDMPKFSAYSIPFAGREIASGRLDLDLGYKMTDGELEGENVVVLRDFELGDTVEHPGALSLPLGLAVALLKDPEGRINIDVPVRGNVNDPEFRYGRVIASALGNLITRIVTSPFALLANLVGGEADELEYLVFEPGRTDLSPPEMEKALKIAEAIGLRPQLALGISGVYDRELDAAALRTSRFDAIVESRMNESAESEDEMFAERRQAVIEQLYSESTLAADPESGIEVIRAGYTTPATEEAEASFDALAFTEALRRRLIDAQPLTEDELLALAIERAVAVRQAVITADMAVSSRIVVGDPVMVEGTDDDTLRMQVQLSTIDDLDVEASENPAVTSAGAY